MVEVEERVARRGHGVTAGVNGRDVVACSVDLYPRIRSALAFDASTYANKREGVKGKTHTPGIGVVLGRRRPEQLIVEAVHVVVVVDKAQGTVGRGSHGCVAVHVTAQAAWVRTGAVRPRIFGDARGR